MKKALSILLILFFICTNSYALKLAQLKSETAEELLLFFEEEELVIATKHPIPVKVPNDYPANKQMVIIEAKYMF